jgi:hypothetical protein
MAGLTAVAATFVATKLDPYSHQVGDFVLTHPQLSDHAAGAWQLPLMPWTDLNNTVVMGSLLIGVTALVPVFVITYPIFRLLAPSQSNSDDGDGKPAATPTHVRPESTHQVVMVDQGHGGVSAPYAAPDSAPLRELPSAEAGAHQEVDFVEVGDDAEPADAENQIAVETRIDVIRMQDHRGTESASQDADASNEQQPMDEALNYLLRQLRDSKQRKAA